MSDKRKPKFFLACRAVVAGLVVAGIVFLSPALFSQGPLGLVIVLLAIAGLAALLWPQS